MYFFFFKLNTAYEMRISDWSSDVCSSDLVLSRPFRLSAVPSLALVRLDAAPVFGVRGSLGHKTAGTNRPAGKRQFRNHIFMVTTANPTRDDFAAMLEQTLRGTDSFVGHVVKGTVLGIEHDLAVIDVVLKIDGRVQLPEFAARGQTGDPQDGDALR